jgi:hypothetical protein
MLRYTCGPTRDLQGLTLRKSAFDRHRLRRIKPHSSEGAVSARVVNASPGVDMLFQLGPDPGRPSCGPKVVLKADVRRRAFSLPSSET